MPLIFTPLHDIYRTRRSGCFDLLGSFPLLLGVCLRHVRIEYLPEVVEIGESSFSPSFTFNRLDNPHQGAGIALFKPVYPNDVVLHDLPLAGHSYITGEVTGRLQEEKK